MAEKGHRRLAEAPVQPPRRTCPPLQRPTENIGQINRPSEISRTPCANQSCCDRLKSHVPPLGRRLFYSISPWRSLEVPQLLPNGHAGLELKANVPNQVRNNQPFSSYQTDVYENQVVELVCRRKSSAMRPSQFVQDVSVSSLLAFGNLPGRRLPRGAEVLAR